MLPYVVKYLGAEAADQPPLRGDAAADHAAHGRVHRCSRQLRATAAGTTPTHGESCSSTLGAYVVVRYAPLGAVPDRASRTCPRGRQAACSSCSAPPQRSSSTSFLLCRRGTSRSAKLFDNRWQTRELTAAQITRFQRGASSATPRSHRRNHGNGKATYDHHQKDLARDARRSWRRRRSSLLLGPQPRPSHGQRRFTTTAPAATWRSPSTTGRAANTPAVLRTLKDLNLKATFFVLGSQLDSSADEPADHARPSSQAASPCRTTRTTTRPSPVHRRERQPLTEAQVSGRAGSAAASIVNAGGPKPTLYRPPYGDINAYYDLIAQHARLPDRHAVGHAERATSSTRRTGPGISPAAIAANVTRGYTKNGYLLPGHQGSTRSSRCTTARIGPR